MSAILGKERTIAICLVGLLVLGGRGEVVLGQTRTGEAVLLAEQSGIWGSVVLAEDGLAYSWGYSMGIPVRETGDFPKEHYGLQYGSIPNVFQTKPFPLLFERTGRKWSSVHTDGSRTLLMSDTGEMFALPFEGDRSGSGSRAALIRIPFPEGVTSWGSVGIAVRTGYFIGDNGLLYTWAEDWTNAPTLVPDAHPDGRTWKSLAVRQSTGLAVDDVGALYGWGGSPRQLGPERPQLRPRSPVKLHDVPGGGRWARVQLGSRHGLGLTEDGRLFGWGENNRGQLGSPVLYTREIVPVSFPDGVTRWLDVWGGVDFTMALGDDGVLYEWGVIRPLPDTPVEVRAIPSPTGSGGWAQATAGDYHRMALTQDGRLYTWGGNFAGQLGRGRQGAEYARRVSYSQYYSGGDLDPGLVALDLRSGENRSPSIRLLTPLHGTQIAQPDQLTLVAQAIDPEQEIDSVEFVINDSLKLAAVKREDGLYTAEWDGPAQSDHVIKVRASDAEGNIGESEDYWVDLLPYIYIEPGQTPGREPNLNEPGDPASWIVTRTGDLSEPLAFVASITRYNSTATVGSDLAFPSLYFGEIPADRASVEVPLLIKIDRLVEPDETVELCLRGARASPTDRACATVVIRNTPDDPARTNNLPYAKILSPEDGSVFQIEHQIFTVAEYDDLDGVVTSAKWYDGDELLRTSTLSPGQHHLRVLATDNEGATAWSESVWITVLSVTNGSGPMTVAVETIDPIAVQGTDDQAVIRVDRKGDTTFPQSAFFEVRNEGHDDDSFTDIIRLQFQVGQISGLIKVNGASHVSDSRIQKVDHTIVNPPPGYGGVYRPPAGESNLTARVIVVRPLVENESDTEKTEPVVFDIVQKNSEGRLTLSVYSNPGVASSLDVSLDGENWGPVRTIGSTNGVYEFDFPLIGSLPMILFRSSDP